MRLAADTRPEQARAPLKLQPEQPVPVSGTQQPPLPLQSQCSPLTSTEADTALQATRAQNHADCQSTGTQSGARDRGQGQAQKLVATQPRKPAGPSAHMHPLCGLSSLGVRVQLPAPGLPSHSHTCPQSAHLSSAL